MKSESKAEDVLQEVFLKVWMNRENLPEVGNFKAFIYTLTRNHIYNIFRKQANEEVFLQKLSSTAGTQLHSSKALDNIALHELQGALQKAVLRLTPQQKQVFELSRMQGFKHDEIVERLGISRNTVKKHIADALRTIRSQLKNYGGGLKQIVLVLLTQL